MASTINATSTGSGGLITTGNSVNQLELQTGDTTRVVIDSSGNVTIQGQGDLRLADSDSSHYVALQAPGTVASNVTFTLPSADGTNGQLLQTNGSGTLSFTTVSAGFTLATPVSTASGDTAEFTGLPSSATVIFINLKSVSNDGNNTFLLQLGTSGSYTTTGYSGTRAEIGPSSASCTAYTSAAGFELQFNLSAASTLSGTIQITKESSSNNTWICWGSFSGDNGTAQARFVTGSVSLSGVLTRLKVFAGTTGGLFDGGEINISYI